MNTGFIDQVHALATFSPTGNPADSRVFAGGQFGSGGAGPYQYIAQWDGLAWQPVGHGTTSIVEALCAWNSPNGPRMVIGGTFDLVYNSDNTAIVARSIAAWTGSIWVPSAFEPGLSGTVSALSQWDSDGLGP